MSFILDALKKSESERQRQSGPALFEVKVAAPRGRFAPWAVLLGALLMVNLVIVAWLTLRSPRTLRAAPAAASAPAPVTPAPFTSVAVPPAAASVAATAPVPSVAANTPASATATAPSGAPAAEAREPSAAGTASGPGRGAGDVTADAGATADDYAPAVEPAPGGSRSASNVTRATDSGLPTYQDAAATPGAAIPELRLDLHVFAATPSDRFVFINMTKLREGESLPQ